MSQTVSVSQALALLKSTLEQVSVTIIGEVSEVSDKPGYKAVYFTISDKSAALSCLMWQNKYQSCQIKLEQGMLVEVSGVFSVYAAKGRMNFDVHALKLAGEGELRLRVAQLAKKLEAEGLMDSRRKRILPSCPAAICVVTSPRGKVVHDVIRTLRRRFPQTEVLVVGVPVEGTGATKRLIEGLLCAQDSHAELILLVRGGGSYEDLMPFNDELLARAIVASTIPVVTGIGHEPDTTIADMVADYRASTPTAAAEHIVPSEAELKNRLVATRSALCHLFTARLERARVNFEALRSRPLFMDATYLIGAQELALEGVRTRQSRALLDKLMRERQELAARYMRLRLSGGSSLTCFESALELFAAQLNALSPLAVLGRGYSITYNKENHVIDTLDKVYLGQELIVRFADGTAACEVHSKNYTDTA